MKFNTLQEMIAWINNNTDLKVVKKTRALDKNNLMWIFTDEGKSILNSNRYFTPEQVLNRIKIVFSQIDNYTEDIKMLYTLISNQIKNL